MPFTATSALSTSDVEQECQMLNLHRRDEVKTAVAPLEKQPSPNEIIRDRLSSLAIHTLMYCLTT